MVCYPSSPLWYSFFGSLIELNIDSEFVTTAPHPGSHSQNLGTTTAAATASEIAHARARTRTREEEHAALCVLDDWELTMTHALNSRRVSESFHGIC